VALFSNSLWSAYFTNGKRCSPCFCRRSWICSIEKCGSFEGVRRAGGQHDGNLQGLVALGVDSLFDGFVNIRAAEDCSGNVTYNGFDCFFIRHSGPFVAHGFARVPSLPRDRPGRILTISKFDAMLPLACRLTGAPRPDAPTPRRDDLPLQPCRRRNGRRGLHWARRRVVGCHLS
jgi:hypothetical protein